MNEMNMPYIISKIEEIRGCSWDIETAHVKQDDLKDEFIKFVSESSLGELSEMAREIMGSENVLQGKWYA